jgi:hypothetical protein
LLCPTNRAPSEAAMTALAFLLDAPATPTRRYPGARQVAGSGGCGSCAKRRPGPGTAELLRNLCGEACEALLRTLLISSGGRPPPWGRYASGFPARLLTRR